jgi:ABC-2 type transport system ATP-binding protein
MVSLNALTFGYGKKVLFDKMDLELVPGGLYGLLGLNGAGKTSLLKLVAGALAPTAGSVTVFGRKPADRSVDHLADVAFVAEDPWVPAITARQWVDRQLPFRPSFDRAEFDGYLAQFAVDPAVLLTKLSYGQKKKFALAAALASGAHTVLLDEPTNGLDIPSKGQFRQVLAKAARPDRIIVVSTHQIRDLETLLDPLVIMDKGKVPFVLDPTTLGDQLSTVRLTSLEGRPVVYAIRDTLGWAAVVAEPAEAGAPDLELVFGAAIAEPGRLKSALAGETLGAYTAEGTL